MKISQKEQRELSDLIQGAIALNNEATRKHPGKDSNSMKLRMYWGHYGQKLNDLQRKFEAFGLPIQIGAPGRMSYKGRVICA